MKKHISGLKLNKKKISNFSYELIGGKTYETIETYDGTLSTMAPCQGGTSCCNNTDTWEPAPIGSGPMCTA